MAATSVQDTSGSIVTRTFIGRTTPPLDPEHSLASQIPLRQFSLERMMAYGVHHADAVELRGRVAAGESWKSVATELAETCLAPPEGSVSPLSSITRSNRLYRASALLRMSQMLMLSDDDERRAIVVRAAALYQEAADLTGDRQKLITPTDQGELSGWFYPARTATRVGCAVVIGGVEGWAMDFGPLGLALADRGVDTLLLDGPGQGESRMVHGHFLTPAWRSGYAAVFDHLSAKTGGAPLAFIGNSMGGSVAMDLAATNPMIAACCENGGPLDPLRPRANTTFFTKMIAHCGEVDEETAAAIWGTVRPTPAQASVTCPLLVVHGGLDPLVPMEDSTAIFDWASSADKRMVVFSDGDHCVYNHQDDKHNLIGDWVASRLKRA